MDRVITYVGQSVYEWLFSKQAQSSMVGMAKLSAAMLGTNTICNGLSCVPTGPASLQVVINPGEIYQVANLEASTCGTLPADSTHTVLKQGTLLDAFTTASGALNPPGTGGQSINYLIEAQYADSDVSVDPTTGATPVVLQFYNSSNPGSPWSGPGGLGGTSNTFRKGVVSLQVKAGTAATTGTQVTPSPDAGWVGLWVVTVANGQSTITAGNIVAYNGAPVLSAPLLTQVQQSPSVVGTVRNLVMSVTAASATASLTADEIVVESALGGNTYKLASFSKTINLATTGAGGMDTGSAPVSGYVALYAIYNPTTQTAALLAQNASTLKPNVYGGANMPAGYTASALVSVWPTNGSGQFSAGLQIDRTVCTPSITALNSSTVQGSPTSLSIPSAVPANARSVSGNTQVSNTAAANVSMSVFPSNTSVGGQGVTSSIATANGSMSAVFSKLPILTPQTIYYTSFSSAGTPTFNIAISSYDI